jgi:nitrogen-specific signal transduction histidine kinase
MTKPDTTLSRKSLLTIINALPLAISVIDKNQNIALVNKHTTRFVNKNESQLIGLRGGEAFGCTHHDDADMGCGFGQNCMRCKLRKTVLDTLENNVSHDMVETSMSFKDHGQRHLRITTLPLTLNNETTALVAIEDITESKDHENVMLAKERLAAAVKTAGAICHEVNQPLMVILGMAELLLEEVEKDDPSSEKLLEIKHQAERLGRVTKKLLTLSDFHTRPYLHEEILDLDKSSPF